MPDRAMYPDMNAYMNAGKASASGYGLPVVDEMMSAATDLYDITDGIDVSSVLEEGVLDGIGDSLDALEKGTRMLIYHGMESQCHDTNNVLQCMRAYFDMFRQRYNGGENVLPPDAAWNSKLVSHIRSGSEQIRGIFDPTPVRNKEIADCFRRVFGRYRKHLEKSGIAFSFNVISGPDEMWTYMNPGKFQVTVPLNLARNIKEHGKGVADVSLWKSPGYVECSACNGTDRMYSDVELEDMFIPRERQSPKGHVEKPCGSHWGLPNVREYIESIGGEVWAESGPGVIEFRLRVPRIDPPGE